MAARACAGTGRGELTDGRARKRPDPAPAFVALSAAQTALLVYLLARDHPADEVPRRAAVIGAGGPAYAGLRDWISIVTALANCTVSYVSGFIAVEVTGEMRRPADRHKAIGLAAAFMYACYLAVGTAGAFLLGPRTPPVVTMALPAGDPLAAAVHVAVLIGMVYGYLLSGIIVGNNALDLAVAGLRRLGAAGAAPSPAGKQPPGAAKGFLLWLCCTLPGNLFSLLVVSVCPHVEDILGLITGLSVVLLLFTLQPLCGIHFERSRGPPTPGAFRRLASKEMEAAPTAAGVLPARGVGSWREAGWWALAAAGVPFSLVILAKTAAHLATEVLPGFRGAESFFCEVVNGGGGG